MYKHGWALCLSRGLGWIKIIVNSVGGDIGPYRQEHQSYPKSNTGGRYASAPAQPAPLAICCFALLCFALLCFALLCFALLCSALLSLRLMLFARAGCMRWGQGRGCGPVLLHGWLANLVKQLVELWGSAPNPASALLLHHPSLQWEFGMNGQRVTFRPFCLGLLWVWRGGTAPSDLHPPHPTLNPQPSTLSLHPLPCQRPQVLHGAQVVKLRTRLLADILAEVRLVARVPVLWLSLVFEMGCGCVPGSTCDRHPAVAGAARAATVGTSAGRQWRHDS